MSAPMEIASPAEDLSKYTMLLETVQASAIKTLFEVLKEVLHDVVITFDADGMRILTADGIKNALVHLRLDASNMERYWCKRRVEVGVNMRNMYLLIKSVTSEDTLALFLRDDNSARLGIRIENPSMDLKSSCYMNLKEIDYDELEIPDIQFDAVVTIPSAKFQKICRDLSNLAAQPILILKSQDHKVTMEINGDFATVSHTIGETEKGVVFQKSDAPFKGCFLLNRLNLFCKATPLCNVVQLYMASSFPLGELSCASSTHCLVRRPSDPPLPRSAELRMRESGGAPLLPRRRAHRRRPVTALQKTRSIRTRGSGGGATCCRHSGHVWWIDSQRSAQPLHRRCPQPNCLPFSPASQHTGHCATSHSSSSASTLRARMTRRHVVNPAEVAYRHTRRTSPVAGTQPNTTSPKKAAVDIADSRSHRSADAARAK